MTEVNDRNGKALAVYQGSPPPEVWRKQWKALGYKVKINERSEATNEADENSGSSVGIGEGYMV
jgi:hypothetical protein